MTARIVTVLYRTSSLYVAVSAIAVGTALVGTQTYKHLYGIGMVTALVLAVVQTAPLIAAVGSPLLGWCLMTAADLAGAPVLLGAPRMADWPWSTSVLIGQAVALLLLVRRERTAVLAAAWTALAVSGFVLVKVSSRGSDGTFTAMTVGSAVILTAGWLVRERADAERRLAAEQLAGQAERERLTVLEERARIARELHDVVAHHMSVIAVQADSAPYRINALSAEAADEFGSVAGTARSALVEMRRLLGVLRDEHEPGQELSPQPGLDQLSELAGAAARAGTRVILHVEKEALASSRDLPAVELAAFRLVQEGLANVVRHAPGADARVNVSLTDGQLYVSVVNSAPPTTPAIPVEPDARRTGHGLIGMRERVRLVGGTLETGALPDGGFRIAAQIPLAAPGGTS